MGAKPSSWSSAVPAELPLVRRRQRSSLSGLRNRFPLGRQPRMRGFGQQSSCGATLENPHNGKAIADGLNDDEVPTAQGGRAWYPATVRLMALGAE